MENREAIKEKEGWSAFRKYLAYYKSYVEEFGKESFSIADKDTIKFVQNHFHVVEDVFEEEKKDIIEQIDRNIQILEKVQKILEEFIG